MRQIQKSLVDFTFPLSTLSPSSDTLASLVKKTLITTSAIQCLVHLSTAEG